LGFAPTFRLAKRGYPFAALALLLVLGAELVLSIRQQSQTWDESVHIFSGYQYWRHGDFGANPEHPPLVKLAASLPLLRLNLKESAVVTGPTKTAHGEAAIPFLYRNNSDANAMLFRGRMAASMFTYLLAVLVFLCGHEMLGRGPALLGLALLVFEPNILANGALVTTDIAETCFLFASVYAFYRYVRKPSVGRLLMWGVAIGLALASKHSGLLLAPILLLLAVSEPLRGRNTATEPRTASEFSNTFARRIARLGLAMAAAFSIGCVVLWAFYGFRFSARPGGAVLAPSLNVFAHTLDGAVDKNIILGVARARLLPESYLWGVTDVLVNAKGRATFLLGQVYPIGQWFYFPLVLLMKCTIAFLVFLLASPFSIERSRVGREWMFLVLPPVVYLGISMLSRVNIGVRHVLPMFPFLILIAAAAASSLARRSRLAAYAVAVLVLAHAASSLHAYPNYLTYSNEVVGGPSKTYRSMTDANVDWGQGLKQAAAYLAERKVKDCWFAYTIFLVDPDFYDIPCKRLQSGIGYLVASVTPAHPPVVEGTILISATEATGVFWGPGELNPYRLFFNRQPDDIIAASILVFHGSFDVSLAAAANHAGRARQLLAQDRWDDALLEAQTAVQLSPGSAEMQATLCRVMMEMNRRPAGQRVCRTALAIAGSTYPEYQFLRLPSVRAVVGMR
jgi:4-amino-4-deoxy-L-arabinose transferase-like glycosyltransferase